MINPVVSFQYLVIRKNHKHIYLEHSLIQSLPDTEKV